MFIAKKLFYVFLSLASFVTAGEVDREKLLLLFSGEWISRALYVATKLEIADHLAEAKSVDELAGLTHSHPESLRRLLSTLASIGVFEEISPGLFVNTEMSALLSKSHPSSLHALSLFYGEDIHQSWDTLLPSIQSGKPAFELTFGEPVFQYFKNRPSRRTLFQEAMKEKSAAVIQSTLSRYDFSRFGSLYDIGGGHGQFLQALLEKHQNMQGTLFDLPEVIAQVKNASYSLIGGNFFTSIPSGADAYLLKSVLHDWTDAECKTILDNCYKAMKPDGRLLILETVLGPEAAYANCMDLLMLAITGGKERNLQDFKRILEASGFVIENVYPTGSEFSLIEVKKTNTLATYELSVQEYVAGTSSELSGTMKTWIDHTIAALPSHPRGIEIGSAFGRDAIYLESQGVAIERTDATQGFVDLLQKEGYPARLFNILSDPLKRDYDLVFANAVFLHFTVPEFERVLTKIRGSLSKQGILSFSVKHGEGEEWLSSKVGLPQFFHYWQKDSLQATLTSHGFTIIEILEDPTFIHVIAKPSPN